MIELLSLIDKLTSVMLGAEYVDAKLAANQYRQLYIDATGRQYKRLKNCLNTSIDIEIRFDQKVWNNHTRTLIFDNKQTHRQNINYKLKDFIIFMLSNTEIPFLQMNCLLSEGESYDRWKTVHFTQIQQLFNAHFPLYNQIFKKRSTPQRETSRAHIEYEILNKLTRFIYDRLRERHMATNNSWIPFGKGHAVHEEDVEDISDDNPNGLISDTKVETHKGDEHKYNALTDNQYFAPRDLLIPPYNDNEPPMPILNIYPPADTINDDDPAAMPAAAVPRVGGGVDRMRRAAGNGASGAGRRPGEDGRGSMSPPRRGNPADSNRQDGGGGGAATLKRQAESDGSSGVKKQSASSNSISGSDTGYHPPMPRPSATSLGRPPAYIRQMKQESGGDGRGSDGQFQTFRPVPSNSAAWDRALTKPIPRK